MHRRKPASLSAASTAFDASRSDRGGLFSDPGVRDRFLNVALPLLAIGVVVLVWAVATNIFHVPDYLLPPPQDVVERIFSDWRTLSYNGVYTLYTVVTGFAASVVIGVPLAFGIVASRTVERMMMPIFVMSQTIPKVAIAPILVVWLGFGVLPKITIAFLIAFFPIVVSTVAGLKSVEAEMIDLVRSMGAGTMRIMLRVRGPTALPQMFAGFKIAICLSIVGAIVGEFVGSDKGLGFLLLTATGNLDGSLIWAALFILVAMGIVLFSIVSQIERMTIPWHVSHRLEEAATYQS